MTIQQPPVPVGPCFDTFVLKFALLGASSTPSLLRQMLDRWAAFESESRHLCTRVITSLRSHSFITCDVVRRDDAPMCGTRCGGEWVSPQKRKRHDHVTTKAKPRRTAH